MALAAVCFSVLFMFMEIGFYGSVLSAAAALYRATDADIFLISTAYHNLSETGTIPRRRLYQACQAPGIRTVLPLYIDMAMWRNPQTRLRHQMIVIGIDPMQPLPPFAERSPLLTTGQILLDSLTRPHFGPQDNGLITEIEDFQVRIAGHYSVGPGFAADGDAVMSDETFVRIFPNRRIEDMSVGLARLDRGFDAQEAAAALRHILPTDTRVMTRAEMIAMEEDYWADQTSLGPVFGSGALLGFVIGMVTLFQVMSADIASHTREYATLKALGYSFRQLVWIVLQEVSAFAVAGFLSGWLPSFLLYRVVREYTGLPLAMTAWQTGGVLVLTISMCWTAGWLAARKIRHADPAELF